MQMNEALDEMKQLLDEIPTKDFKENPIGYNKREVDEYLDSICDVMANVLDLAQEAQNQPDAQAAKPAPAAAPVVKPVPAAPAASSDGNVQEVLALAVRLKNDIISEAQTKADEIIADAEKKARERLGDLGDEHIKLEKQLQDLKQAIADYREKFEALLQQQQEAIDKASDLF